MQCNQKQTRRAAQLYNHCGNKMTTTTFEINNREYTIEKSISGDYCRLLYRGKILIDDSACEDFYGEPKDLIDIFKSYIEEEASKRAPWWTLMDAMFEWGSDPQLIEGEEQARSISDVIENAERYGVISDQEEIDELKSMLDLDDYDVKIIHTFVNGSSGAYCFVEDYE